MVRCEWGVVKIVYTGDGRVYVIHDPMFYDTGVAVAERLAEKHGRERVIRLNTGVEEEGAEALRLLDRCPE